MRWMLCFVVLLVLPCAAARSMAPDTRPAEETHAVPFPQQLLPPVKVAAGDAAQLVAPMVRQTADGVTFLTTPIGEGPGRPTPQDEEAGGRASFQIDIPEGGTWLLFAKVFWQGGASNSFWVRIDKEPYERLGNDGAEKTWIFWKGPAWDLEAGKHTLTVREREWGSRVAELYLTNVPDYVARSATFADGRFTCQKAEILIDPPYCIRGGSGVFQASFFRMTPGKDGLLAGAAAQPLTITGPDGRQLWHGSIKPTQAASLLVRKPQDGTYTIQIGELKAEWQCLWQRSAKLEARRCVLTSATDEEAKEYFWVPTLNLCWQNIQRGWRRIRQDETALRSLPYVLEQFDRGERIAAAIDAKDCSALDAAGAHEMAFFSKVDKELCPFVLYLPEAYFKTDRKMPLVLYLHGANGTQWELNRTFDSRKQRFEDIRWPVVVPYGRGNSGYAEAAEKDLVQMLGILLKRYRFDEKRVVVCGYSLGGMGTWRMVADHPAMFEAAVPNAGWMPWLDEDSPAVSPLPKDLRTRITIVHSADDHTVPMLLAEKAKKQLTDQGIAFRFITYDGGHVIYPGLIELLNGLYK